jgi:diacylglycerol O-acyltransferase / wax synthase
VPAVDRASPVDYLMHVMDVGPVPLQVGAVVRFAPGFVVGPGQLSQRLAERATATPRLRQRLVTVAPGCGRPIWVDDAGFHVARHVQVLTCPPPGDDAALLGLASRLATTPLPLDRPRWSMALVGGLADDSCALVAVLHHVLADGMGGLAVLKNLADSAAERARGGQRSRAGPFGRGLPSTAAHEAPAGR